MTDKTAEDKIGVEVHALTQIITILQPFKPPDQQKILRAVTAYFKVTDSPRFPG